MFKHRIGHALINFTNELGLDFSTRCSSCTSRRIECRPYGVFFFFSRDVTDPTTRKNKIDQNHRKKLKKNNRANTQSLWTYGSNRGLKIQCKILKIERGIAEIMPFFSKLLDLYMELSFGNISWWVANWATRLTPIFSLSLQHCLHQNFILIENDNIYTKLVSKSWCFGFSPISRRDRVGEKKLNFSYTYVLRFFSHNQWCVRVSLVLPIFVVQFAVVHEVRL